MDATSVVTSALILGGVGLTFGIVIAVVGIPTAIVAWYKFFREVAQPEWITSDPVGKRRWH